MPRSSRHGSRESPPLGRSFSPSTVIVRSPTSSTKTKARRCGDGSAIARTVTPCSASCTLARRPRSSPPSAVKNVHDPASFASWTAATAPPPAASSHVSRACTISPGLGTCSTRTNSTHSTWPITATFTPHILVEAYVSGVVEGAIPPFEAFYEQHRDEVLGFLAKLLGRDGAEDAFQETFLRALRAYPRLEHGTHLRAWVLTIAGRIAIDEHRRRKHDAELPDPGAPDAKPAYAELAELTGELPPTERAAVVLRYGYDLDYAQIGAALGSNAAAARQAASAGIRRLRTKELQ